MKAAVRAVSTLRAASPWLTTVGVAMLALTPLLVLGVLLDPRVITGVPAWVKPTKFALSIAVYSLTLAWVMSRLTVWPRARRLADRVIAGLFWLEIAVISLQAARGTTSHFNVGTPLDAWLFQVMGLAIVVVTGMSLVVAAALFRQRFADPVLGWSLRLGLVLAVAAALLGGRMLVPTAEQRAAASRGEAVRVDGAHTVGAPDGGPGLPVTNWSTRHGDLRVPHFLGLHAFQALPLLGWLIRRTRALGSEAERLAALFIAAAGYAALVGILFWQALRGQSVIAPDGLTLTVLGVWLAVPAGALLAAVALGRGAARSLRTRAVQP
jgi:hypothetical protein